MDDLKAIVANNIVELRHKHNLTQLDLAEKLNYSDKAVSKWERGESCPDVSTLKDIAELFSVTVDYLLHKEHPIEAAQRREYTKRQKRNRFFISAISCVLVWLVATAVFVNLDLLVDGIQGQWLAFVYAVPVTAVLMLVFNSIWGQPKWNYLIISVLMWSVLASLCLTLYQALSLNLWLLFLIGVPGQVIIGLWSGIRK